MGASIKAAGGGGRKGRRKRQSPMSEINVTPFVDVMLVLLIVFMVAAPLMTGGVPLDLPAAKTQPVALAKQKNVVVSITKDGNVYLGDNKDDVVTIEQLGSKLKAIMEARGKEGAEDPILVRGDLSASYGIVAKVLARIKESGFRKMSLITDASKG
jgi:biopolymer transport protein TolR